MEQHRDELNRDIPRPPEVSPTESEESMDDSEYQEPEPTSSHQSVETEDGIEPMSPMTDAEFNRCCRMIRESGLNPDDYTPGIDYNDEHHLIGKKYMS